jgi:arylsulfatase A-like enzyme
MFPGYDGRQPIPELGHLTEDETRCEACRKAARSAILRAVWAAAAAWEGVAPSEPPIGTRLARRLALPECLMTVTPLTTQIDRLQVAVTAGSPVPRLAADRPRLLPLLPLWAWCGLVSGLLEVGITIARKQTVDWNQLYWRSRHFIWLVPLTNLVIFLILGVVSSLLIRYWQRPGRWLAARLLCLLTVLSPFWAAFPEIHGVAGCFLALGVASRLVPALERRSVGLRRLVRASFPFVASALPVLALSQWGIDRHKLSREQARPLPPPSAPNVLLIVLDTVGAGHLSLYGYQRPTSPTLDDLAPRGIRFDRAKATSSFTLPSHASMFTGRWPHELSAGWISPLDDADPTLAEFLGSRGYATTGIIANYSYCAADSGLGRGFTDFRDYIFPGLTAFHTAVLIDRLVTGMESLERFGEDRLNFSLLSAPVQKLGSLFHDDRKSAAVVNHEFLDWLSRRRPLERPFFAFLNFYDAHSPYQVPKPGVHRFTDEPPNDRERNLIEGWTALSDPNPSDLNIAVVRDAYDKCVADLDEQLGRLIDELERRGVLERTWVILTADHGESFGEHKGVFLHGTSLYQTEVHVPLLIIPPGGTAREQVVTETVSLRNLPATIVDVLGLKEGSPFSGDSLARFWTGQSSPPPDDVSSVDQALSEVVPLDGHTADSWRFFKARRPLAALTAGAWTYIRRAGDGREELYRGTDAARESHNLAADPALRPTLERLRLMLDRLTSGPLTPERFNP